MVQKFVPTGRYEVAIYLNMCMRFLWKAIKAHETYWASRANEDRKWKKRGSLTEV